MFKKQLGCKMLHRYGPNLQAPIICLCFWSDLAHSEAYSQNQCSIDRCSVLASSLGFDARRSAGGSTDEISGLDGQGWTGAGHPLYDQRREIRRWPLLGRSPSVLANLGFLKSFMDWVCLIPLTSAQNMGGTACCGPAPFSALFLLVGFFNTSKLLYILYSKYWSCKETKFGKV